MWLVYRKKPSGQPSETYAEVVEEAFCLGWIDSHPRQLDVDRTQLLFTRHQPKSGWSKVNKERLARLETANMLLSVGLAARARQNGDSESLDAAEAGTVPKDLAAALAADGVAARHSAPLSISARKDILTRVLAALSRQADFDRE